MNLKILFLCISAVAATSHNHHLLRHQPEQHSIVFQATKGQLRRLLRGEEEAPSKDLEALHVLRGASHRFLKSCKAPDGSGGFDEWKCDEDTHKCGNGPKKCDEVCDKKKDCNNNGECDKGKCKCKDGYQGKSCDEREVVYTFVVQLNPTTAADETRSPDCDANLKTLAQLQIDDIADDLPSTVSADSKSKRSSSNKSQKGALEVKVQVVVDHTCDTAAVAVKALEELEAAEKLLDEDGDDLPDSYECLSEKSKDLLKDVEDKKDAKDLEVRLDGLIDTCDVLEAEAEASCLEDCHDGVEKECEDEVDKEEEDDCKGLHKDLKDCYKDCYGL